MLYETLDDHINVVGLQEQYVLRKFGEIENIVTKIAAQLSNPENLTIALHELLVNALEHGVYEIGFEYKSKLLKSGLWQEEINKRISMPNYANRQVDIELRQTQQGYIIEICDHGKGFDWQNYLRKENNPTDLHGRGIVIALSCGFDSIFFNEIGNKATCIFINKTPYQT